MEYSKKLKEGSVPLYRYTVIVIVIWTILVAGSLAWNFINERNQTRELAKKEALSHFNKDQAIRLWAASHGGVYVPPDEKTPPSPYLVYIPDRDIKTTSGKYLTLMNPAYMLRQMMEEYSKLYGIKGRITSLKVLNPINIPDEWERSALKAFDRGVKEVFEFADIKGAPYLRLMRPMITKKPCLKCHGYQGYKVGDIRGGVGVSVPMTPYLSMERAAINTMMLTHGAIWFLGLLAIGFVTWTGKRHILERKRAEETLRESEGKLQAIINNSTAVIFVKDLEGKYLLINSLYEKLFHISQEQIIGKTDYDLFSKEASDDFREADLAVLKGK